MIADLHIHSKFSYDSILSPEKILKVAKKRGLHLIAITDHETIRGGIETVKLNRDKDFFVIVGCEINTDIGDIIGLFLTDEIKSRNYLDVISEIREQGGIVILPHPFRGHLINYNLMSNVDAIEVFNGRLSYELNFKAKKLAETYHKSYVAGSDAHFAGEIGNTWMIIDDDLNDNFKEILLKKNNTELSWRQCPRYFVDASQVIKSMKKKQYFQSLYGMSSALYHAMKEAF